MPDQYRLDLNTITLGEMMDIELASGRNFGDLVRSRTGLLMIALYLQASQRHALAMRQVQPGEPLPVAPTWREIAALAPSAALRFASPESPDSD